MYTDHQGASPLALVDAGPQVDRDAIERAVREILVAVGEDPDREGLRDTPRRVASMYQDLLSRDPVLVTDFENPRYDQMIAVRDIPISSLCEHHLLPFAGNCHVAYVPNGRVVGLSKLVRIARFHAAALQIQERLTEQIADDLMERLQPKGVAVMIEAEHTCMGVRGVKAPNVVTATSALRGVFLEKPEARAEFLSISREGRPSR